MKTILHFIKPIHLKIHTTIGVYANSDYKINGVESKHLASHIEYNKILRWGRALFVDGKCIHQGYLTKEECDAWEVKIKDNLDKYTILKDTAPYE